MSLEKRVSELEDVNSPKLEDVTEERIKEIVLGIMWNRIEFHPDDLYYEIIRLIKCDKKTAFSINAKMNQLGYDFCGFSLAKFAIMRGYVTEQEVRKINDKILEEELGLPEEDVWFHDKHGWDTSKWSKDTQLEYRKLLDEDD